MSTKLQVLSKQTLRDLAEVRRRVLGTSRPRNAQSAGSQLQVVWYWGKLLGAIASDGTYSAAFLGGSFTKIEYLCVELRMPAVANPAHLDAFQTGAITAAAAGPPTVFTSAAHGLQNGQTIIITGSSVAALNGIWTVANCTTNTFTVQGTVAGSGSIAAGTDVSLGAGAAGATWTLGAITANRDSSLTGSGPVICKIEFAFGEWSPKWVGCNVPT